MPLNNTARIIDAGELEDRFGTSRLERGRRGEARK
jgi:hypothetical protein